MSSSGSGAASRPSNLLVRSLLRTDRNVTRLAKILGATSTLDTFLLTTTYTLHLVHAILARATTARLDAAASALASQLSAKAKDALLPGETLIATIETSATSRLLRAEQSTKALTGVIDEFRMFMRLRGLVNMWVWGAGVLRKPNGDAVLQTIATSQVLACTVFQALENWAYLAMKGVVGVSDKTRIARAFVWSARFWMCHVVLDFLRLARQRQLRLRNAELRGGEEEKEKASAKDLETWWRELYVNMAWMPLTVHWSSEKGFAGEAMIAILGGFAGWTGLRQAWKNTA